MRKYLTLQWIPALVLVCTYPKLPLGHLKLWKTGTAFNRMVGLI